MISINTENLRRSIASFERAFGELRSHKPGDHWYEIILPGCVKEFDLTLDQKLILLCRRLRLYLTTREQADDLTFRDAFRYTAGQAYMPV